MGYDSRVPAPLSNARPWEGNLAGVEEIAETLCVSKSTVVRWAEEELLPRPYDYLALGRVWTGHTLTELREALSLVEPPPEDGKRDHKRARGYAKLLRELRTIALAYPDSEDWESGDPAEEHYLNVKWKQETLISDHARDWRQSQTAQNGSP